MSGILTRFPCSANKNACPIARVAHLPQKPCYSVYYMRACFTHTKRPLLPCYLAGKRSLVFSIYSVSVYAKITFLFKYERLVGWLVGWLVARIMPIIYILVTIYHARVHLLSRIYIPILPQSGVIVKRKIFRGFGRILGKDFSLLQPEQPVSRIYPANPVVMDFRVVVHSEKDFRIVIFDCTQRAQFSLKCLFITNR